MKSAQEFAQTWHQMLFERNMSQTWGLMTEDFRRAVAQAALGKARERGEDVDPIVVALSSAAPVLATLQEFFSAACTILQNACGVRPEFVAPGETTRIEAPTYEVVRLYVLEELAIDAQGNRYLPNNASATALTFITTAEESGSWRMAGIGAVMSPGWPPTVNWEPTSEV